MSCLQIHLTSIYWIIKLGGNASLITHCNRSKKQPPSLQMHFRWFDIFGSCDTNIEIMWSIFKEKLLEGVVSRVSNFNSWRKLSWKSTLPVGTRQKIRRKHRLWTRYFKTRRMNIWMLTGNHAMKSDHWPEKNIKMNKIL